MQRSLRLVPRASTAMLVLATLAGAVPAAGGESARPSVRRHHRIGTSVQGRPVVAFELGNPEADERVLVVGCIHGNECAGIPIARKLIRNDAPRVFDLFVIPDLNPDGFAANTRQNGRGVDLNRNFPWRWRKAGERWSTYFSGPRPLSEPESRVGRRFVLEHRPDITFWFHQHMDLVWASGGDLALQRCYARLAGIRFRRLKPLPGSASDWINHTFPERTSTVIELPAGRLSPRRVAGYASAVRRLATWDARRPDAGPCPA
ncbi:MAG: M14 family zinc carboxypeptidase [Actinomycetota bacterium]